MKYRNRKFIFLTIPVLIELVFILLYGDREDMNDSAVFYFGGYAIEKIGTMFAFVLTKTPYLVCAVYSEYILRDIEDTKMILRMDQRKKWSWNAVMRTLKEIMTFSFTEVLTYCLINILVKRRIYVDIRLVFVTLILVMANLFVSYLYICLRQRIGTGFALLFLLMTITVIPQFVKFITKDLYIFDYIHMANLGDWWSIKLAVLNIVTFMNAYVIRRQMEKIDCI